MIENELNINQKTSVINREALIAELWADKRERRNTQANLSMYVALPSPRLDADALISGVITNLAKDPNLGFRWAEDFGRVTAAVHPRKLFDVELSPIGETTRSYMQVQSTKLFDPGIFLSKNNSLCPNTILLNDQPVTIEGFVVELVHMVDELVWTKYLQGRSYEQAVQSTLAEGINIKTVRENKLLDLRNIQGELFPIRIYGSRAIPSVPLVMGGVIVTQPAPLPFFESVRCETVDHKSEINLEGNLDFGIGVTMAKELHAGHLALVTTAEIGRSTTLGRQVRIFDNDTGPRVAAMLSKLSQNLNLPEERVAQMLRAGEIAPTDIVTAYRSRNDNPTDKSIEEVESGGGILLSMEQKAINDLTQAGFTSIQIARESEYVNNLGSDLIAAIDPIWSDVGFSIMRTSKGISLLGKNGQLTGTSKLVAFYQDSLNAGSNGLVLVDSEKDGVDSVTVGEASNLPVAHVGGCGMGIGGKVGSGTGGELPTITELKDIFSKDLADISKYLVLTRYLISETPPSPVAAPFYDFESGDFLLADFGNSAIELANLRLRLDEAQEITAGDQSTVNQLNQLQRNLERLSAITSKQLINEFKKPKLIGENNLLIGQIQKYEKRFGRSCREEIYTLLLGGLKNSIELTAYFREKSGIPDIGNLPTKEQNIQSTFLRVALSQGYRGENALARAFTLLDKKLYASRRSTVFFDQLIETLSLIETGQLDEQSVGIAQDILQLCRERVGF